MDIFGFEFYQKAKSKGIRYHKGWAWRPARLDLVKNPQVLLKFPSPVYVFQEKKFLKGYSLLISKKNAQVGGLIHELKKRGRPFLYINWDEFIKDGVIVYNSESSQFELRYKRQAFNLNKVHSIYYDYTDIAEVLYFQRSKFTNKEKIFLARWVESLRLLEYLVKHNNWYPAAPSHMTYDAQNKFGELIEAQKMGFRIPKIIYTNDPREAQKFLFDHAAILKESGIKFFENAKNQLLVFGTQKVDPMSTKLSRLHLTPCMFQEYIDKKFDVRAVVIDNQVLACKIDSQKNDKTKLDWRGSEHLTPFSPYKLPADIKKKLIRFTKKKNFRFACFDLVVDQKGKHYFLEMNRPGQWFFIEALSGIPISQTLAKKM